MFAVPGWSLGSGRPKRDTAKPSKKRKTQDASDAALQSGSASNEVTATKSGQASLSKDKRPAQDARSGRGDAPAVIADDQSPRKRRKKAQDSEQSKSPKKDDSRTRNPTDSAANASKPVKTVQPLDSAAARLTPLQSAMQKKLLGARFRHLNESLYTTPSAEAVKLFENNPTFFEEYHSGFRSQVASWPENPVDTFVSDLKQRGSVRLSKHGKPIHGDSEEGDDRVPALPRSKGKCNVIDLGCGDASLAREVKGFGRKAGIEVRSYDLQSTNALVTRADISALPLPDDSVNVAIFCLALMGTNWIDFIEEAWRVLHWKGELWVAEIKSRFGKLDRKRAGSEKKMAAKKSAEVKKRKQQEDENDAENLIEDAVGTNEGGEKTDVSAFIAILKKRGFVMENERNADMSNKMFVRMRFIKAVKPIKGKYKAELPANASFAAKDKAWRNLLREDEEFDETSALKPCMYKIR